MKNTLFWRLSTSITIATIILFLCINKLTDKTEWHMSFIAEEHQEQLRHYAQQAENMYLKGENETLKEWLKTLQAQESTWVAIVKSDLNPILGTQMQQDYLDRFVLGRGIDWKIHLYFNYNPIMEIPFVDKHTHFLIQLPARMRPGAYWQHVDLILQIALPLLPLLLLTWLIYRYVMSPLQRLSIATRKFSAGDYNARARADLGVRQDELTDLADTFDQMAENTSKLIIQQRQLIADLSHELRTPITRMEMAIGSAKQSISIEQLLPRLEKETNDIRTLIEDTLTLAWLENEKPQLKGEQFDLIELINVIIEDAEFEFPNAQFVIDFPQQLNLVDCSQRALAQALENLIRNALKYSPIEKAVTIKAKQNQSSVDIIISDQGLGVPEEHLENIFQPFFRVDKSRDKQPDGFGLGLALARRQIEALSGTITASNTSTGLQIKIQLPYKNPPLK